MTVRERSDKLNLKVLCEGEMGREITGCYIGDLLSWVMGRAQAGNVWITIMTNMNVVAVAVLADVACVLLPENAELDQEALKKAEMQDVVVLQSQETAFELAGKLSKLL